MEDAMETTSVRANCNWLNSGGCDITKAIQTRITHEDIFVKPELDEILREDRAVLLTQNTTESGEAVSCELSIRVFPRYKIESITFVCSVPKIELFLGPLKEYTETVYGAIITDDDVDENLEPLISYRYDIEIQKSGIVELCLKLLTPNNEICIYGILLQIAPNPNGITTLMPSAINLDNVQKILSSSNQKISPSAEKCKLFMQMYNKNFAPNPGSGNSSSSLIEQMKQVLLPKTPQGTGDSALSSPDLPPTLDNILKIHIDMRFQELEAKIMARFDFIEAQQTEKLDKILKILEEKS